MSEPTATGRYRGPSALGEGARRFASLTFMLAATDFKLRWFGSALGYLWTLMKPLMLFGVLYLVFTEIVRFGEGVENYPVYLLTAIVLFTYFSETTGRGVTSLVDRDNLLRKIRFPRLVIPLSVALHSLFNLGLNMLAVFVFVAAAGIEPTVDWLQLPLLVAMIVILATGVTMLLSALYVRYRDVEPIWEVGLQLLFYASPVIYVVETIPDETLQKLAVLNPIGAILTQMRHALVDPSAPTAITELGGWQWLSVPVGITVALFALGWWVFRREAPRIAENL